jgi:excisionase family DNA binding protein
MAGEDRLSNRLVPRRTVLVDAAAVMLGVSRRTVYYRIREGKLRTVRTIGGSQRVLVDSIESLILEEGARGRRRRRSQAEPLSL